MSGTHAVAPPGRRLETHSSLPSTQELLKERLRGGEDVAGLVIRALVQTSGVGRRGTSWSGLTGGSYQSMAFEDPRGRYLTQGTPLAVAVGIAEVLREAGAEVLVKWPNDLYLGGGKLGGVLCEHLRGHLVVGVGVNVANEVPPGASALLGWALDEVGDAVIRGVDRGLGLLEELAERYAAIDFLAGRQVVVRAEQGIVAGTAAGITSAGELQVVVDYTTERLAAGTVLSWEPRQD